MADNWNKAAETQEQSEIQRLVKSGKEKKCKMWFLDNFYVFVQFQSENINEVSINSEVKPQGEEAEEAK